MKAVSTAGTQPSRRDLITARFSRDSYHIASLLVQARPDQISDLTPQLGAISGVEVHNTDERGQMVLSVEASSDSRLLDAISDIERASGVITVSLAYHQSEDEGDE